MNWLRSNDMNYVAMEKAMCPVCGKTHETGGILLDRRLKDIPEEKSITHYALCEEHQSLFDEGYVALVELALDHNPDKPMCAPRTGNVAHIRRTAWENIFDTTAPDGPIAFTAKGVIAKLKEMQA
jgi:hypothetical protein